MIRGGGRGKESYFDLIIVSTTQERKRLKVVHLSRLQIKFYVIIPPTHALRSDGTVKKRPCSIRKWLNSLQLASAAEMVY